LGNSLVIGLLAAEGKRPSRRGDSSSALSSERPKHETLSIGFQAPEEKNAPV
jgi:hypothetical protein